MTSLWRERLVVVLSFVLIFAFNSIDNAIAPLVSPLSAAFGVSEARALWLISVCSGGTVIGLIFGPSLLQALPAKRCLPTIIVAMTAAQILFALSTNFPLACLFRFLAGAGAGLVASVMWQLTFHGVSKAFLPAMIAVLMSARPLATALGVPLAGLLAFNFAWQLPVWVLAILTGLSGLALYRLYPNASAPEAASTNPSASGLGTLIKRIFSPYGTALKAKYATPYYLGTVVNRMAYFGFYSFCGIWFERHYGLNLKDISFALLIIGLSEALVNFSTNRIIAIFGHKATFLGSLLASAVILPLFIFGGIGLKGAVALIALFMLLDRVYSMCLVISVPKMFPIAGDMTAFGSLNTLTAWGAMCLIAWLQGWLGHLGLAVLETIILVCFFLGGVALVYVQAHTVFHKAPEQSDMN